MTVKTSTRERDGIIIVDLVGELRLGEATGVLREAVRQALAEGYKRVLLNLGSVRHIDSSGVGELMSCFTSVRSQGGQLKLMNLNQRVHSLLQITKLVTIFETYDDEEAAVTSFG